MPDKLSPRPRLTYRRVPSRRRLRPPKPIFRRSCSKTGNRNQPRRILSRSASEPILYTVQFDVISRDQDGAAEINRKHNSLFLPRPHTFTDGGFFSSSSSLLLPSPSPPRPNFMEEAKVVVSVTVEGSPGPVRAMVKLGATVDETIGVVVDRYKREGRSPRLDWERADSFELHHSHFSLQNFVGRSEQERQNRRGWEQEFLSSSELQQLQLCKRRKRNDRRWGWRAPRRPASDGSSSSCPSLPLLLGDKVQQDQEENKKALEGGDLHLCVNIMLPVLDCNTIQLYNK